MANEADHRTDVSLGSPFTPDEINYLYHSLDNERFSQQDGDTLFWTLYEKVALMRESMGACVNACRGIPTEVLEEMLKERKEPCLQIAPDSLCFTGGHLEVNTDQSQVTYRGVELPVRKMTIEIDWEAGLGFHPIATLKIGTT